jgi:hypothetical protein
MYIQGTKTQQVRDLYYRADGSVTGVGSPVLVLPEAKSRSYLLLQNISNAGLYFEFGSARATCSITNGKITNTTITNPGFGFKQPPIISPQGGGAGGNSTFSGGSTVGYPSPSHLAVLQAVLTGGVLTSINILDGGSGYVVAPTLFIQNSALDTIGCADPSYNSGSGLYLPGNGASFYVNGTTCGTDQIACYGVGSGTQTFTCFYLP